MKHTAKYLFLLCSLLTAMPAQYADAVNKQALADSLTVYANSFARVGKVKITRIRVDQDRADIFTNKNLSYLSLSEEQIARMREIAVQAVYGEQGGQCYIFTDGYEISELESSALRNELHYTLPPQKHPLVQNTSRAYKAERGLEGFHIALYGSHGLYFNQKDERWTFQRARLLTTVEDLYTTSYTMPFLVPMLENAGAIVLQPRERDTQLNEVLIDDAGLSPAIPVIGQSGRHGLKADKQDNHPVWQRTSEDGFAIPTQPLTEGENPFTAGGYAFSPAQPDKDKAESVTYYLDIPQAGDYAVYVSYKSLPVSTNNAQYTVVHSGMQTSFSVNQRMSGGTWVYIGTFAFSLDRQQNYISLSNYGKAGTFVTTDAVKVGGGMGSVARYAEPEAIDNIKSSDIYLESAADNTVQSPSLKVDKKKEDALVSGFPRYIEGARYWMQYAGIPDSVYNYTESKNDYIDDYAARGRWINWLIGGSPAYPRGKGLKIPVHLGLAFHTDAGLTRSDSTVGTLIIYMNRDDEKHTEYPTGISRLAARNYADIMQTQIVNDIRASFAPEWQRRELMNSSYSEARNPMTPTVLLELLSHQNPADMKYGLDPRFRFTVSRAIYKAMLRYLHEQYDTKYIVQPLPVRDFAIDFSGKDSLCLRWQESIDTLEATAKPDYFVVYTRKQGYDWDNGVKVENNKYFVSPEKDTHYDFRVVAGNRGGISFPSETLSARIDSKAQGRVLLINGFDRVSAPEFFQRDSSAFGFTSEAVPYGKGINFIGRQYEYDWTKPWVTDDNGGFGSSFMDHADCWYQGNTFDYPALHGKALDSLRFSYVSTSASAVKTIPDDIKVVDLILGKQKQTTIGAVKRLTAFPTFTPALRETISEYNLRGGNLLVSGAYIVSDEAADKEFLQSVLHIKFAGRHATRSGKIMLNLPGQGRTQTLLLTEPNTKTIHTESPDGIASADKESKVFARYRDSFIAAGVAHEAANNTDTVQTVGKTLVFSFPLESLDDFDSVYLPAVQWLVKSNE